MVPLRTSGAARWDEKSYQWSDGTKYAPPPSGGKDLDGGAVENRLAEAVLEVGWVNGEDEGEETPMSVDEAGIMKGRMIQVHVPA